jgi:hypothetical protein
VIGLQKAIEMEKKKTQTKKQIKKPAAKKAKKAAKKTAAKKAATKKVAKKAPAKKAAAKKSAPKKSSKWKCPNCERSFAKTHQPHSCQTASTEVHFKGKNPVSMEIYNALVAQLRRFGEFRVDAVKTSINLIHKYHFGSVTVQDEGVRLGFVSDEPIRSSRIVQTQELGPSRVGHSVKLKSTSEVDAELLDWLRTAHALQG